MYHSSQITTISFFKFTGFSSKVWAFGQMQFAHSSISKIKGQQFYRLLGTGKERFNPRPDWGTYAILQVWESEKHAQAFFEKSKLFSKYCQKSKEHWVLHLKHIMSRGKWGGGNPFQKSGSLDTELPYLAVITRATIKTRLLFKFWKYVPHSQTNLWENPGLIYTKGVGEFPIRQMATFSLWKDKQSLNSFAYQTQAHTKAITKTREYDWYKEELFSRFQPFKSVGTWGGRNPLPALSIQGYN